MVRFLIDNGADVNIKNKNQYGKTAIDFATLGMKSLHGHRWSIIEILIEEQVLKMFMSTPT